MRICPFIFIFLSLLSTYGSAIDQDHLCLEKSNLTCSDVYTNVTVGDYATISIFDLDDIELSEGADRKQKVDLFGERLKECGFVGIKVDGLKDLIDRAYEVAERYFALPVEDKNLDAPGNERLFAGYHGVNTENLSNISEEEISGLTDFKETFLFDGSSRYCPKKDVGFDPAITEFHDKVGGLSNRILKILKEYLEVDDADPAEFSNHSPLSAMRLTRYPPISAADRHSNIIWCSGHFDISPFALLPKATTSGLQMKRGEDWINIDVPDDTVIFNTGRLFEVLTAGIIKPTYHRVLADDASASIGRISIIHFAGWDPAYFVQPWESCLQKVTKDMNENEKIEFEKGFLRGTALELISVYTAIVGARAVSDDEIRQMAKDYPDNRDIRAKWPYAF